MANKVEEDTLFHTFLQERYDNLQFMEYIVLGFSYINEVVECKGMKEDLGEIFEDAIYFM